MAMFNSYVSLPHGTPLTPQKLALAWPWGFCDLPPLGTMEPAIASQKLTWKKSATMQHILYNGSINFIKL